MIDLYFVPTPNGYKIALFLEEAGPGYHLIKIDLGKGGQSRPEFLCILPNNKIPATADYSPVDGGEPLSLFESGIILLYLAEKTGLFSSCEMCEHTATLQWLFWQAGGLGSMSGQNHHLNRTAPQTIPYAIERYQVETQCLYHVLNKWSESSPWLEGKDCSIMGTACWPWVNVWTRQRIDLTMYPVAKNWHERIRSHPTTGLALLKAQHGDERSDS